MAPDPGLNSHFDAAVPILAESRVVPFLGAGVNCAGRNPGAKWSEGGDDLPDAWELARWLADKAGISGHEADLLRIAQILETLLGRGELHHRLHQVFEPEPRPTAIHKLLAGLPARLRSAQQKHPELRIQDPGLLVVTTNYDDALEGAFRRADEPFDVVTYIATGRNAGSFAHLADGEREPRVILVPNEYVDVSPRNRTVILKIHGAVDRGRPERDSYVITQDDYIDFLATSDPSGMLPVTLAAKLQTSHLLFLGYGLKDWNLRVILRRLWGAQEVNFVSWAVQLGPDAIEKVLWKKRDVEIHDADLADYTERLDRRLAEYLRERPPLDEGLAAAS